SWHETELLPIFNKSKNQGILLVAPQDEEIFLLPFDIKRGIVNSQTGRAQAVICDFCRTWRAGSYAGSISIQKDRKSINSVSFLCCADLFCSRHVRGETIASRISKAQLREDITTEKRVKRLKERLNKLVSDLR